MDYVKIPLTKGYEAIIDAADFALVGGMKWQVHAQKRHASYRFYAHRNFFVGKTRVKKTLHRFLLNPPDGQIVDHINGDGLDNRRSNLRLCTLQENARNQRQLSNKTGFKGVKQVGSRIEARIGVGRSQQMTLGCYKSLEEAAVAYDLAAKEMYGDFAATNRDLGLLVHMSDWQYEQLGQWLLENTKLRHYIDRNRGLREVHFPMSRLADGQVSGGLGV